MHKLRNILFALALAFVLPFNLTPASAKPLLPNPLQSQANKPNAQSVTAYDLIIAMNTLRVSLGNQALLEDPIINAVAQATAEIMAANQSSWHIGDVSGRIQAAGFGGGSRVFATENFAVGGDLGIDQIMLMWSDESHMFPAVNPAYCAVGAGTAKSANGLTYYVLQAAYVSGKSCGEYTSVISSADSTEAGGSSLLGVSQIIVPVEIAAPDAAGKIIHQVKSGQSLWAIAVAYKVTIDDIARWNNITREAKLQVNQELVIPSANTEGYQTPTPVGWIIPSTPMPDGSIHHEVQAYNTLSSIAQAYNVPLDQLLVLNQWSEDWPLQIGQDILVKGALVTPSPTQKPLSPLEKLTPEADGRVYHVVQEGESASWIAELYGVNMLDLMAWNSLTDNSVIQPGDKLVLQVTLPASQTPPPPPETATPRPSPSHTPAPPTPTLTLPATQETVTTQPTSGSNNLPWIIGGVALAGLLLLVFGFSKPKAKP